MAERGDERPAEEVSGEQAARVSLRAAGYCVLCDRLVELAPDGSCAVASDHPREAVSGRMVLSEGEVVPQLPRFNLAAFLIPPIWGPANGQWAGAVFLPIWLFADSIVASASYGSGPAIASIVVAGATLAAQAWFGKRGNGLAWRRVCGRMDLATFVSRQRIWAFVAAPTWLILVGWAVAYRLGHPF